MNNQTKILALLSIGAIASYLILKKNKKLNATGCPSGMQLYYGTCIPIKNEYAACPQGYMKERVGGECVKIPDSTSIGGCGAGEEYRMGYRLGDMTATMGCYPIGANMDINMGSSTGGILGGGAGTNIGGGGTVQGGGGNYSDTSESHYGGGKIQTNITCNENQVYDAILGMCVNKEVNPILNQQIEEDVVETQTSVVTCPDNYELKNGLCYPKQVQPIIAPKNQNASNTSYMPLLIGGGLLLGILVLALNKKS